MMTELRANPTTGQIERQMSGWTNKTGYKIAHFTFLIACQHIKTGDVYFPLRLRIAYTLTS